MGNFQTTTSPLPAPKRKDKVTISFPHAIERVGIGERITKLEWGNSNIYGILKDGLLMLHKDNDKFYHWVISDGDILGDDWVVIS